MLNKFVFSAIIGLVWTVVVYTSNMTLVPALLGGAIFGAVTGGIHGWFFSEPPKDDEVEM